MDDRQPAPRTARALARETITREILDAARRRLADEGPAALSLRAVARDVGMVSSGVYRYFPSRDALLTALIVECYDELGERVEAAEAAAAETAGADGSTAERWMAACRAVREWSVVHPGEFALLYGTPVPGYDAPQHTVDPATRVVRVLVRVVADSFAAGSALPSQPAGEAEDVAAVVAQAAEYVSSRGLMTDPPAELVARTLMAWTTLFGTVSFELYGHLVGSAPDAGRWFDVVSRRLGDDLGIRRAPR